MIRSLTLFWICLIIYWLNGSIALAAPDSWVSSIFVFNLLEHHTLHLDVLRSGPFFQELRFPYFLLESPTGHLTSAYPIGTTILTAPLYVIFYVILKCQLLLQGQTALDINADSFLMTRLFYEKVAASVVAAATIVIFDRAVQLKFTKTVALISSLILAFATSMWSLNSQALWQHGSITFLLTVCIYGLFQANRTQGLARSRYLLLVGMACGLLPGVRPTAALFSIAIVAYGIYQYRYAASYLLPGLSLHSLTLLWNWYYFGNFQGSYKILDQAFKTAGIQTYSFAPTQLFQGFAGLLFSPSRGLLVFSPILLYAIYSIKPLWRKRHSPDEQLLITLTIAALLLFLNYCAYFMWWGGFCYGPRFLSDILPIFVYLISYGLATLPKPSRSLMPWLLFGLTLLYSIGVQAIGAFSYNGYYWDTVPAMVSPFKHPQQPRLWDGQDSRIVRGWLGLWHQWQGLPKAAALAHDRLQGQIISVIDAQGQAAQSQIFQGESSHPMAFDTAGISLQASIQNTGTASWYGYRAALGQGEVQVRGQLYNSAHQMIQETRFHIRENTPPGKITTAIGFVPFPDLSDNYSLKLDLIRNGGEPLTHSQWQDPAGQTQIIHLKSKTWRQYQQEIQPIATLPTIASPNQAFALPLSVTNRSNFIWNSQARYPIKLSYRWFQHNQALPITAIPTNLPKPLPINHQTPLTATIKTPPQPGNYRLVVSMREEQHDWFDRLGAKSLVIPIQIIPKPVHP
jgi:hypothetical protein